MSVFLVKAAQKLCIHETFQDLSGFIRWFCLFWWRTTVFYPNPPPASQGPQWTLPSPLQDQVAVYINYEPSIVENNRLLSLNLKKNLLFFSFFFFASLRVRIQFNWIRDTKWCTRTPRVTNVSHYFLPIWGCYLTGLSSWDWWTDFHPVASGLCERTDHALRWVCFFFLSDDGSADPPGVRLSLCLNKNLGFSTLRFSCVSKKLWHWFI